MSYNNNENDKESKEPDYDDDKKSDKVGEEQQEEETGEIAITSKGQDWRGLVRINTDKGSLV